MDYRIAGLDEIRIAFFTRAQEALALFNDPDVWLAAPAQDAEIDLKKLAVITSFIPSGVARKEFGGSGSLAERHGVWKALISIFPGTDENRGWELAQKLEDAFLEYAIEPLPVAAKDPEDTEPVCPVFCDFPYTEPVGTLPDGRHGITVTVPWWTWTQSK